jgi:superfamily II DNA or RNA helicase
MYYPWYSDKDFNSKVSSKKELFMNRILDDGISDRCIENYQYLVSNFLNPVSPYRSLLLYFYPGVGKTLSAITIAENFIRDDPSKQILVITKSKTLIESFKSDLLNICSPYTTEKERDLLKNESTRKNAVGIVYKKIKKNYSFITYDSLKKSSPEFTDKVVIIDEIHNLIGNTGYKSIMKSINMSKNYKLVLLSATPAYDNIIPLFELSNILNGRVNQLPISIVDLESKNFINKINNEISTLYKNKVFRLTDSGRNALLTNLRGRVSYLRSDTRSFPKVNFPNSTDKLGSYKLALKVIPCVMEGEQKNNYSTVVEKIKFGSLDNTLQYISSIVYPDINGKKVFGKQGIDYYVNSNRSKDFLLEKNIKNYSIKLYTLLQNLKNLKGKAFIHSDNITNDGIPLIKACLEKNGYSVLSISSNESAISEKIKKFNSVENDDGSWKQIILGSKIVEEGVTFKSIRQVHIYEPSWNYSTLDQKLGRAIRRGSHDSLPSKDRTVDVYLYCALLENNLTKSVDVAKFVLSSIKDVELKSFERGIARSSFSCNLFKNRNIQKNGVDGSRECEYTSCNYSCDFEQPTEVDSTTYNMFFHNKEGYSRYSKEIEVAFKGRNEMSIDDIVKATNIDKDSILSILNNTKSPVKVAKRGNVFIQSLTPRKASYNILPKKIKRSPITGYLDPNGAFIIKVTSKTNNNKFTEKNCNFFKRDELVSIANSLGLDNSGKKSDLCTRLKSKLI